MAIIVKLLDQSTGTWNIESGSRYTLNYSVENTEGPIYPVAAANAVYSYSGFDPSTGSTYPDDSRAYLTAVDASQTLGLGDKIRIVTLTFEYIAAGEVNPLLMPPKVNFSVSPQGERVVYRDIYGKPILNRAGFPPADPVTVLAYAATLSITKTYNQIPFIFAYYADAVNADGWLGFAPLTVKCLDFSSNDQGRHPFFGQLYECTINFQISPESYRKWVLNSGTMVVGDGGKIEHALTDQGENVSEPVLLDMIGRKLPNFSNPIFLPFDVNHKLPFTGVFF